jgi:hypothetical protein
MDIRGLLHDSPAVGPSNPASPPTRNRAASSKNSKLAVYNSESAEAHSEPTTPSLRARGRSARRRTEAGFLLDSLQSEICTERGSSSDRRRRQRGLPPARSPAEILGIDDLVLDESSMAKEIEAMMKMQKKILDSKFDEIFREENAAVQVY